MRREYCFVFAHGVYNPKAEEIPMLRKLFRREEGQDMIEYAILAAFISIVAIVAIKAIGPLVNAIYVAVEAALT